MCWFGRKNKPQLATEKLIVQASLELTAQNRTRKEAVKEVNEVNKHVGDLFKQNGFTVQIFEATGGRVSRTSHTKKGEEK